MLEKNKGFQMTRVGEQIERYYLIDRVFSVLEYPQVAGKGSRIARYVSDCRRIDCKERIETVRGYAGPWRVYHQEIRLTEVLVGQCSLNPSLMEGAVCHIVEPAALPCTRDVCGVGVDTDHASCPF